MSENTNLKSSLPKNINSHKEGTKDKEKIPKNIGQFIMGILIILINFYNFNINESYNLI